MFRKNAQRYCIVEHKHAAQLMIVSNKFSKHLSAAHATNPAKVKRAQVILDIENLNTIQMCEPSVCVKSATRTSVAAAAHHRACQIKFLNKFYCTIFHFTQKHTQFMAAACRRPIDCTFSVNIHSCNNERGSESNLNRCAVVVFGLSVNCYY